MESIRAGLVFQLKEAVGVTNIEEKERDFVERAITSWETQACSTAKWWTLVFSPPGSYISSWSESSRLGLRDINQT